MTRDSGIVAKLRPEVTVNGDEADCLRSSFPRLAMVKSEDLPNRAPTTYGR